LYTAGLVLIVSSLAAAQSVSHPPTLTPEGAAPLPLAGQARRVHLLGTVELYALALYTDSGGVDRSSLVSSQTAKALRIEIVYQDDPQHRLTIDWRRELIPTLDAPAMAHLRGTFAPLQQGDVVLIEYTPRKGTSVRVNKAVAVSAASHDLMLAFLDHWLGQRPVSEEMKRSLITL
jgi:hypothetical protein